MEILSLSVFLLLKNPTVIKLPFVCFFLLQIENKVKMRSRPDSGIAVSTSSASYASSEHHKDIHDDIDDPCGTTSCQEMCVKVKQVRSNCNLGCYLLVKVGREHFSQMVDL